MSIEKLPQELRQRRLDLLLQGIGIVVAVLFPLLAFMYDHANKLNQRLIDIEKELVINERAGEMVLREFEAYKQKIDEHLNNRHIHPKQSINR